MRARAKATKQHDDEPHLLLGAAAMLLQTTIGTVRRLAVEGKIASSLDPIGRRVIKLSDIESELAQRPHRAQRRGRPRVGEALLKRMAGRAA